MKKTIPNFLINFSLLIFGLFMVLSGLILQINYHMGHHGPARGGNRVWGINHSGWSDIHKISITLVSVIIIIHIVQHWKCYKTIIKKKLFAKNQQLIVLSIIFIITAITGFIPWFIHAAGDDPILRKTFIEIHDKIALILLVYLILHVGKRRKWYFAFPKKVNS